MHKCGGHQPPPLPVRHDARRGAAAEEHQDILAVWCRQQRPEFMLVKQSGKWAKRKHGREDKDIHTDQEVGRRVRE